MQTTVSNDGENLASSRNINRVWVNQSQKCDYSQMEAMLNRFHEGFTNQINQIEQMMSVTMGLHSKMQENLKFWFRQRELEESITKRPKLISNIALPLDQKLPLTTVPKIKDQKQCCPKNDQTTFSQNYSPKTFLPTNYEINKPQTIVNRVKESIKIELIGKDTSTKHDYKLESRVKFDNFYEFLTSELRTIDLLYVIDKTVNVPEGLNDTLKEKHKFKVRDILINRIDKTYNRILQIKDIVKMLNKIKEIKCCGVNVTSVSARKQLYAIQYNSSRETAKFSGPI